MNSVAFLKANFLLPNGVDMNKWSVIACDQYTSDQDYWKNVEQIVGENPSALRLILPEVYLAKDNSPRVEKINESMHAYLDAGILKEYNDCYIYLERTLASGVVRPGIVGVVDMEQYSYIEGVKCDIKPTEKTVPERIPPRKAVRDKAQLELAHVILFCNDKENSLVGYLASKKNQMKKIYDFEMMMDGGHIAGWLVDGEICKEFDKKYAEYCVLMEAQNTPQLIVGDGNHSLATAKSVYEDDKTNKKARYAMVELQNIYDDSIAFEPIHRVLFDIDVENFLKFVESKTKGAYPIQWMTASSKGELMIDVKANQIPIETLQPIIDEYLLTHQGDIDYVHDGVEKIVSEHKNSLGIFLPAIQKGEIFDRIATQGVYPRKTFSVGEANDKRFYLEARIIK
ncbi:MAG: DUF1015 domain-containing protein [Phascolarctobacterium sp.]|nr:DUF1015 domain-containing protein [Phascolarctobacterium sp.]